MGVSEFGAERGQSLEPGRRLATDGESRENWGLELLRAWVILWEGIVEEKGDLF